MLKLEGCRDIGINGKCYRKQTAPRKRGKGEKAV